MKDNFRYVDQTVTELTADKHSDHDFGDGNPKYLILCANINSVDTWLWKFCLHENNFTPVFSNEYGDCSIPLKELEKAMKYANEWVNYTSEHTNRKAEPVLYLCRVQ